MSNVKDTVVEIVEDFLLEGKADDHADLYNDLSIGTFEFIEMIVIIQDTLKIEIKDDDVGKLVTVLDLVNYVEKAVKEL